MLKNIDTSLLAIDRKAGMKTGLVLAIVLAFVLSSCALSPQTVAIKPLLDVQSYPIGRGRSLALDVVDQRPDVHFGARGGVYGTALISSRVDVAQAIRQSLAERLSTNGFSVTLPQPASPLSMRVEIQRIDYIASGDPIVNEIQVRAAIRAITRKGEKSLSSQYKASNTRQVLKPPNEVENEALINEVVAETLKRMLNDKSILDLLAQ